jgi:hypothetical protein
MSAELKTVSAQPQRQGENMRAKSWVSKVLVVTSVMLLMAVPGFSRDKNETIDAQAFGTGTQLGRNIGVTLIIYQYSTPEDRAILVEAFQKGSNQGLVNALERMKAVGHIAITGTLGYDVSYIALIPTPTGRKIRFATNRLIRFGEMYYDTQSKSFDLSGGEIELNDQDKSKSGGVLWPAAQLGIDAEGQLSINLRENPWRLANIIDWKGTPGEN